MINHKILICYDLRINTDISIVNPSFWLVCFYFIKKITYLHEIWDILQTGQSVIRSFVSDLKDPRFVLKLLFLSMAKTKIRCEQLGGFLRKVGTKRVTNHWMPRSVICPVSYSVGPMFKSLYLGVIIMTATICPSGHHRKLKQASRALFSIILNYLVCTTKRDILCHSLSWEVNIWELDKKFSTTFYFIEKFSIF